MCAERIQRLIQAIILGLVMGMAAMGIAWLTVGYQAIKAALANPVEALRYE